MNVLFLMTLLWTAPPAVPGLHLEPDEIFHYLWEIKYTRRLSSSPERQTYLVLKSKHQVRKQLHNGDYEISFTLYKPKVKKQPAEHFPDYGLFGRELTLIISARHEVKNLILPDDLTPMARIQGETIRDYLISLPWVLPKFQDVKKQWFWDTYSMGMMGDKSWDLAGVYQYDAEEIPIHQQSLGRKVAFQGQANGQIESGLSGEVLMKDQGHYVIHARNSSLIRFYATQAIDFHIISPSGIAHTLLEIETQVRLVDS